MAIIRKGFAFLARLNLISPTATTNQSSLLISFAVRPRS